MDVVVVESGGKEFDGRALLRIGNDCGTKTTELLL
jgi:hypothetical protein